MFRMKKLVKTLTATALAFSCASANAGWSFGGIDTGPWYGYETFAAERSKSAAFGNDSFSSSCRFYTKL